MRFLHWCRRYLRPEFFLTVGLVAVVLLMNDNSVIRAYEHDRRIEELHGEIEAMVDTMEHYRALNRALSDDAETMERVARENYHMQRPDEDVYVFTTE